jgi:tetratricopeptide (TPR) repeat protein
MIRKLLVLTVAIALAGCRADAQTAPSKWADTLSAEIQKAFLDGDIAKVTAARAFADRVATAFPDDALVLHYQGFALWREATAMMGRSGGDPYPLLERALKVLEKSLKTRPLPETHVLMSSIDGQLIAKDPSRAMELGIASSNSSNAAVSLGPKNPRVWLIRGQGAIYTPPEYGGGLKNAEEQLRHAIELFDADSPKTGEPSWGKAEAHLWLGQVYEKMNDKTKAAAEYRAALAISPDFNWAKGLVYGAK